MYNNIQIHCDFNAERMQQRELADVLGQIRLLQDKLYSHD